MLQPTDRLLEYCLFRQQQTLGALRRVRMGAIAGSSAQPAHPVGRAEVRFVRSGSTI
jgi:hypothetical protein